MDNRINFVLWSSRSTSPILTTSNVNQVFEKLLKYKCPNIKVRVEDKTIGISFDLITVRKNWIVFHNIKQTEKYLGDPYKDVYCRLKQMPCVISELNGCIYYFAVD